MVDGKSIVLAAVITLAVMAFGGTGGAMRLSFRHYEYDGQAADGGKRKDFVCMFEGDGRVTRPA